MIWPPLTSPALYPVFFQIEQVILHFHSLHMLLLVTRNALLFYLNGPLLNLLKAFSLLPLCSFVSSVNF